MTRKLFTLAAAIGVVGAWGTTATADDSVIPLGRYQPTADGFTGGLATPGSVAADGAATDTEQVHWHRYRSFGWGFRPYSSFGFYRPFYGHYHPGFAFSYYSAPRFYAPPVYFYPSYSYGYSYYYPGWCGIGLKEKLDVAANVVDLALRAKAVYDANRQPEPVPYAFPQAVPGGQAVPMPSTPSTPQPGNNYRYDGGPANPVPMPTPDAQPAPRPQPAKPAPAVEQPGTVQISAPARVTPSPYRYRAYGEK